MTDAEIAGQMSLVDLLQNSDGETEEYKAFVDKFRPKKTTDDCYTPPPVYDAVADWVAKECGVDRATFSRPFYPGGDYTRENYEGRIVVDNPPFSILSQILHFYCKHGVRFFLFAPALTLFSGAVREVTYIGAGVNIVYANGASVNTSFATNLERWRDVQAMSAPTLRDAVKKAADEYAKTRTKSLPKYAYPDELLTFEGIFRSRRRTYAGREAQEDTQEDTRRPERPAPRGLRPQPKKNPPDAGGVRDLRPAGR